MGLTSIKPEDLNYAISIDQTPGVQIKPPFLSGNLKPSTKVNITDPNFGKLDGHLDEINPSQSKFFDPLAHPQGMYYNTRHRNDVTISSYDEKRDSYGDSYQLQRTIDPSDAPKDC